MSYLTKSYGALHGAVLLFALSALFAKWLSLPATTIVIGRAFFAVVALYVFIVIAEKKRLIIDGASLVALIFTGALLALHWLSFFYAIQQTTVALGLITFATFPVFVSVLEPVFFNEKFCLTSLLQALLSTLGIGLVVPLAHFDLQMITGAVSGIISAIAYALLIICNRKFVKKTPAHQVVFFQNLFAFLWLLPIMLLVPVSLSSTQLGLLIVLGVVFTALAHSIFNYALKRLKAQTAAIALSLEPIYGIIAAYLLLDEKLNAIMILGGIIIIVTNFWASTANMSSNEDKD